MLASIALQLAAAASRVCSGPFRFADVSALADGDSRISSIPDRLAERTRALVREDARISADEFGALIRRIRRNAYSLARTHARTHAHTHAPNR